MQNLVIVESPTKARTLAKFLGSKYQIEASMGHIRDLPKAELGVDVDDKFEPKYVIPRDKKKKVNELKRVAKEAKNIFLATDPDREGEAIAWHLNFLINNGTKTPVSRVVFHEITESAIKEAFNHPRKLDNELVNAQQARRVLDRLVGYKLSPLLWKKVKRGLSAGRVQTVALRLTVEREREIEKFVPLEFWSIEALLEVIGRGPDTRFITSLVEINNQKIDYKSEKGFFIKTGIEANVHVKNLENATYKIDKVTKKEVKRTPAPPFTTSTLQQAAGNKLGFTAKKTMMLAQNLYEHGLITYMRTDSFNLSPIAITAAREMIGENYGAQYLTPQPRLYKSKSKNAQEAHEAIRPTNVKLNSDHLNFDGVSRDHKRLYDLIWKRMIASQMADALLDQTTIDVNAKAAGNNYLLRASGSILKFDGWLKVYGVKEVTTEKKQTSGEEQLEENDEASNQILPEVKEDEPLDLIELLPKQHFTQPPPRYTESSLIKKLEELGIGRPSTYAPTLSTIQDRYYVERQERKFVPTALGMSVVDFLVKYFPEVFDYEFTALMEDQLDDISRGEKEWRSIIGDFYKPFEKKLAGVEEKAEKVTLELETVDKNCPDCGKPLVVRIGRFGKFLACSGFPDCKHTEALEQKIEAKCPEDDGEIMIRRTKTGKTFYGCKNWPNCKYASWTKPK